MIDKTLYSGIYTIPLPDAPNNSFDVVLDGLTFNMEFRSLGDQMLLYIYLGDLVLVNGRQICLNIPINLTSTHSYNGGHFWFEGIVEPRFDNFGEIVFYYGSF